MAKAGNPASLGIGPGDVLLGKYRIDQVLGHGGMGVVAQATHLQLEEKVAIKFLRADMVADEATLRRFLREAQAAARLKSEHVAHVTDVGTIENGAPYMVMEFLEGEDVAKTLAERGALHPHFAIDLVLQACVALAEAHSIGIVHRDIKPTNLFITWRPDGGAQLKVLDFGISKVVVTGEELSLTSTMSLLGTPAYMAPEQMRSARDVDSRSDIWSLGTVLFEMVEGQRPFYAETFTEMCVRVITDPPAPLTASIPEGLGTVIMKCLEKEPEQRYQTIGELASDLAPLARDPVAAREQVTRMHRMLSRRDSIPRAIPDVGSAPVGKPRSALRGPAPGIVRGSGEFSDQATDIDTALLDEPSQPAAARLATADVADPAVAGLLTTGRPKGDTLPTPDRSDTAPAVSGFESVATSLRPRRRGLWIGLGLAVAVVGIGIAVGASSSDPKPPPGGATPAGGTVVDEEPAGPGSGAASPSYTPAAPVAEPRTPVPVVEPPKPVTEPPKPVPDKPRPLPQKPKPVVEKPKPAVEKPPIVVKDAKWCARNLGKCDRHGVPK